MAIEAAHTQRRINRGLDDLRLGRPWSWLAPAGVAALVFAATLAAGSDIRQRELEAAEARFDRYVGNVTAAISEHLAAYEQILRGANGLLQSSSPVDAKMWRTYAESLRIADSYPGLQGVGFARYSREGEADHAVVALLEPAAAEYPVSLGRDLLDDAGRRGAMKRARDLGVASLSNALPLPVRAPSERRTAFEMYLPVYGAGTRPLETAPRWRTALRGFVYGAIDMGALLDSLRQNAGDVRLTVREERAQSAGMVVYQSTAEAPTGFLVRDVPLSLYGRNLTLRFETLPAYAVRFDQSKSWIVLLAGFAIGLLLASLVWALNRTRRRALALVQAMAANAAEIEEKYRRPVEAAEAVLYAWHVSQRRFLYVAPQVEALLGYPAAQWTDEDFWISHVHPEDRQNILELTRDLNRRRIDRADEYRMITAEGRTIWIRDIVKFDDGRDSDMIYGVLIDVTEIKQAEFVLRESQEQFRSAMDHSSIGMALVAPDGKWLRVNRALCTIVGYSEHELLSLDFQTITHPDDLKLDLDYVGRMLRREIETYQLAKRYVRKDGSLVWILLSVSLVWNLDGTPRYFISQIQDISDRRSAEQALRESERRFRNLVESANVIPYAWDILAKRYIYVGPQIERLFGQAPDLWTDRSFWMERLHPDDRERILAHSQSFARHPQDTQLEYRIVKADGGVVWVNDVIKVESSDDGRLIGYGIIFDITQAKQRDAQLQHGLKMEAVGQLTSGIAHDFNNLLGIAIGNLDLLLRQLPRRDRPARGLAEDALSAALLGADITKRLLAYSRRQPMRSEVVNLNDLTMQTVTLLRHTIGAAVKVRTRLARDLWPVDTDPAQFESALTNLAINARDAMAEGGSLTVRTANRHVTAAEAARDPALEPGDYVELTVADTGCGMPEEVAHRAFDPFFTTKEPGHGSGLGLSMVYGFAKQSKGQVAIRSRIGHGTTVSLLLPRASTPAASAALAESTEGTAVSGSGRTILIVEDNARMRKTAVAQLTELGYRTVEADCAAKAITVLEATPDIDLMLSDVVMPGGMNGVELTQTARRLRPSLKVLLISGFDDMAVAESGRGELLLAKPYRQEELADMLSRILLQEQDEAA